MKRKGRRVCDKSKKAMFRDRLDVLQFLAKKLGFSALKRAYQCEFCRRWHFTSQVERGTA